MNLDMNKVEQFAGQVVGDISATFSGVMTNIGHKLASLWVPRRVKSACRMSCGKPGSKIYDAQQRRPLILYLKHE